MSKFVIVDQTTTASLYLDSKSEDFKGLSLIGETFVEDVKAISGKTLAVVNEVKPGTIVVGSIGQCDAIDQLIEAGTLNVSDMIGKNEVYRYALVDEVLYVIGTQRISAIFGLFQLSEKMGVSPWIYWGDVTPKKKDSIVFTKEELTFTSKEPSIRYRGFFMNDEWPCLGNFVMNTFGDFNAEFYRKVFELLLRLKGNYFWPAMWSASFPLDGGNGNPLGNMELSDAFGITACFSHHEPMTRASEEWDKVKSNKNNEGYGADWNYDTNGEGLYRYWADGLERDKHLRNMITIGMRGERDTSMLGPEASVQENVDLLRKIISDQQKIIKETGCEDLPQMLALYKEVEGYYYGSKDAKGLCEWDALDPVTLLLSDDNFGNVRTLPTKDKRDRKSGWGLYYHFDYHGGPISYEWVSSMPLQKTWEQVTMAYDYGIRDLWVVNVGDLRPQEVPLSYFMELAYDFESWGTDKPNKTREFLTGWVDRTFGIHIEDAKVKESIVDVLIGYARMHGNSKPEATFPETYHASNFNEAKRKLAEFICLEEKAKAIKAVVPAEAMDAFYSMVYYPAVAGVNLQKANIYAALNQWYSRICAPIANDYRQMVEDCIKVDGEMTDYYHKTMANGKWNGMMLSSHFCFESWNEEGSHFPITIHTETKKEGKLFVHAQNAKNITQYGTLSLPEFTSVGNETYEIEMINGGIDGVNYKLTCDQDFVVFSKTEGSLGKLDTIQVSIDWTKVTATSKAVITAASHASSARINVTAKVVATDKLPSKTFIPKDNVIAIEAEHFASQEAFGEYEWKNIENYGKTLSSMKVYPTTENFDEIGQGPSLTYKVLVEEAGKYNLSGIVAPTNNLEDGRRMRYAVSVDGGEFVVADTLPEDFFVGEGRRGTSWAAGVLDNCHKGSTVLTLSEGVHEIKICSVDAGLVLQKLVLYKGELPKSHFGPEESLFVK